MIGLSLFFMVDPDSANEVTHCGPLDSLAEETIQDGDRASRKAQPCDQRGWL